MTAEQMRQAIMTAIKANGQTVSGEFWLMLVFRTDAQLREICRQLHIAT